MGRAGTAGTRAEIGAAGMGFGIVDSLRGGCGAVRDADFDTFSTLAEAGA